MKKNLYFKVYQDKESMEGLTYIDTPENIMKAIPDWLKDCRESGENMPVIEPIEMTDNEFSKLPEFTGY